MDFSRLDASQLAELVVRDNGLVKSVGVELETRTPDEAAARHVEAAYGEGRVQAWLAAELLGRIAHTCARPLLERVLAQPTASRTTLTYAACALVRVQGPSVISSLEILLRDGPSAALREAAATALALAKSADLVVSILAAASRQKLRPSAAALCLRDARIPADTLTALLGAREEHSIRLGTELVLQRPDYIREHADVREASQELLRDADHRMSPGQRRALAAACAKP